MEKSKRNKLLIILGGVLVVLLIVLGIVFFMKDKSPEISEDNVKLPLTLNGKTVRVDLPTEKELSGTQVPIRTYYMEKNKEGKIQEDFNGYMSYNELDLDKDMSKLTVITNTETEITLELVDSKKDVFKQFKNKDIKTTTYKNNDVQYVCYENIDQTYTYQILYKFSSKTYFLLTEKVNNKIKKENVCSLLDWLEE